MATEYRNNVSCQKTTAFVLGFNWHLSLFESPFGTLGIEALMDGTFSARYNGRPACELIGV
jgi:hypothetical protein